MVVVRTSYMSSVRNKPLNVGDKPRRYEKTDVASHLAYLSRHQGRQVCDIIPGATQPPSRGAVSRRRRESSSFRNYAEVLSIPLTEPVDPEMRIEREGPLNPLPLHHGEASGINQGEILIGKSFDDLTRLV